jgi:hypothetical protein
VKTAAGKLYPLAAIDLTSKSAFVQRVDSATRVTASAFPEALDAAVLCRIYAVLTDHGIQLHPPPHYADGPAARYLPHTSDLHCAAHDIDHRFTSIDYPWAGGQLERMNRTIEDATVKRFQYDSRDQLPPHLDHLVYASTSAAG